MLKIHFKNKKILFKYIYKQKNIFKNNYYSPKHFKKLLLLYSGTPPTLKKKTLHFLRRPWSTGIPCNVYRPKEGIKG
jgi:hypothetical protein